MKKPKFDFNDYYKSEISFSKSKAKLSKKPTSTIMNQIPKTLKDHIQSSKYEHLNETLNDILKNMMQKEQKWLDFNRNRESLLHNPDLKNVVLLRSSSFRSKNIKRNKSQDIKKPLQDENNLVDKSEEEFRKDQESKRQVENSDDLGVTNLSFYEREMMHLEKKQLGIEYIKNLKRAEELKNNTNHPQISENSKKIIQEKFKYQMPIYQRTADLIENKKLEESKLQQKYGTNHNETENLNKTNCNKMNASKDQKNSLEDSPVTKWLKKMQLYKTYKERKLEKLKSRIEEKRKDLDSSFTFKPSLSKYTDILAKKKISNDDSNLNKTTFERLHEEKELQTRRLENMININKPSFSPFINRKKQNYFLSLKDKKPSFIDFSKQNQLKNKKRKSFVEFNELNQLNPCNHRSHKKQNESLNISGVNDSGYKLNIRSCSAWVKEKENQIVLKRKMPNTLKSLI
jgi:hypothetical protein